MTDDSARTEILDAVLRTNPVVRDLLEGVPRLGLPSWYLGGGAIAQTVWNHLHGFDPQHGIRDYDLVYFEANDLSEASEAAVEARVAEALSTGTTIDVTNEARVHTWYERRFGRALTPYLSVEDAVATWPTTATSIGVRSDPSELVVCAPFGLDDLFSMNVRANTALITPEVYATKVERWRPLWPRLRILPWPTDGSPA